MTFFKESHVKVIKKDMDCNMALSKDFPLTPEHMLVLGRCLARTVRLC